MTTLSVLICTYNRHDMLQKSLDALVYRTEEKPDQVVVVNGGDTRADDVVHQFVDNGAVEVTLIKTVNKNLAASRNIGIPHCTGDIVAMTDDDAEVFPDWITQLKRIHRDHPEAGIVGGAVIGSRSGDDFLSRLADIVTFSSPSHATYVRTLPGVNVSYKRQAVDQAGPQDEELFRGEDVDYNWRIKRLGFEIFYHPDIKVIHHHRPTLKAFINQFYMYGRAYVLVRRKWPDMYCVYPHRIRTPKDMAKFLNFFLRVLYGPFFQIPKLRLWTDRFAAIPTLWAIGTAWNIGVLYQMYKDRTAPMRGSLQHV
jgi:GT2 family glycosyltransferase